MDDREEFAGIGFFALDHRRVLQMLVETGVAAAIAGKPVGQEMGPRHDVRLEEGAEFGTRRGWQHGDPGVAGEEPVLTLHGMAVFSLLVLCAGTFSTAATTRLLSGWAVLRPELVGSPRPPMKASSASRNPPADGPDPRSPRGAACAPWSRPSDTPPPVRAAEIWPRRRACRDPSDRRQETTSPSPSASAETL